MPKAFTRALSPRLSDCELTHLDRQLIDVEQARLQHSAYERILEQNGLEVIRLPNLPSHPDGVFVEDTALLLNEHAIITRPGAASRLSETHSTAAGLAGHFDLHRIGHGFVDGGDVLRIGQTLYVGLSSRTNEDGMRDLRAIAARIGFDVVRAELTGCLHLKTAATFAGVDAAGIPVLLYHPASVDSSQFASVDAMAVHESEPAAANCLSIGGCLVLSAGNPRTAEMLRRRGFDLVEVDVSELQKAEAGLTCMSLIEQQDGQAS
jgi:dimethylargininase